MVCLFIQMVLAPIVPRMGQGRAVTFSAPATLSHIWFCVCKKKQTTLGQHDKKTLKTSKIVMKNSETVTNLSVLSGNLYFNNTQKQHICMKMHL